MSSELKFAWAYLIMYGKQTNGKWCYYSGCWEGYPERLPSWETVQQQRASLKDKVLSIGIDWNLTKVPEVSDEDVFSGTFNSDHDEEAATLGTLYLKNGESFMLGSSDDEAAALALAAKELKKPNSKLLKLAEMI